MKRGFTLKHYVNSGFTLIELLVVIGVLAVVAAGVVALINPQDKLRQARDAKVQSDIGQIATALQSYAAQSSTGSYPTTAQGTASLVPSELQSIPRDPNGVAYPYSGTATLSVAYGPLTSSKQIQAAVAAAGCSAAATTVYWKWSSTGQAPCFACTASTASCP